MVGSGSQEHTRPNRAAKAAGRAERRRQEEADKPPAPVKKAAPNRPTRGQ